MSWFDKLERRYGRYAIKNLIYYIIVLYALGYVVMMFWPEVYANYLSLNAEAILHGQVWRIVTFIIQPTNSSLFFMFISLYFYYILGSLLERVWGAFKFNVYYFMGVILTVVAAIMIYLIFGLNFEMSTYYINMALFLAFATINPEMQVLLFFILPIKIKWLAYFDGAVLAATIIFGYAYQILPYNVWVGLIQMGIAATPVYATAALVSLLNFAVFLLATKIHRKTPTQKSFAKAYQKQAAVNAGKKEERGAVRQRLHPGQAKHRCAVCGRTEKDGEQLEFRYCSKCYLNYEYCSEHLYTHKHVTEEDVKSKE